jgi:hypothetical protein
MMMSAINYIAEIAVTMPFRTYQRALMEMTELIKCGKIIKWMQFSHILTILWKSLKWKLAFPHFHKAFIFFIYLIKKDKKIIRYAHTKKKPLSPLFLYFTRWTFCFRISGVFAPESVDELTGICNCEIDLSK